MHRAAPPWPFSLALERLGQVRRAACVMLTAGTGAVVVLVGAHVLRAGRLRRFYTQC